MHNPHPHSWSKAIHTHTQQLHPQNGIRSTQRNERIPSQKHNRRSHKHMHRYPTHFSQLFVSMQRLSPFERSKGRTKCALRKENNDGGMCSGRAPIAERCTATNELLRQSKRKLQPRRNGNCRQKAKLVSFQLSNPRNEKSFGIVGGSEEKKKTPQMTSKTWWEIRRKNRNSDAAKEEIQRKEKKRKPINPKRKVLHVSTICNKTHTHRREKTRRRRKTFPRNWH